MIALRGTTLVELDHHASEADKPFGIITADCSSPHEFDDGISITPLPAAQEMYRVSVFAADTSPLYTDELTVKRVMERTESRYRNPLAGSGKYEPMLDSSVIAKKHFIRGTTRSALVVSFVVGAMQPPSNTEISFGNVEVRRNYPYNRFGDKCRYSESIMPFGRAASFILKHYDDVYADDEDAYHDLIHVPRSEAWQRGSNINQAFMVAANHLVARTMRDEDRLAIYRTHDTEDETLTEILDPSIARYSTTPGAHNGLNLEPYCRVTSPLRRAEDFIMHGLLKARADERSLGSRDHRLVNSTVRRLNQRVVSGVFSDNLHPHGNKSHRARSSHLTVVGN